MRVLILRALKLGDFLTGVPAYRALRRAYPGAHIQLAAPRPFASLLDLLDGALDEVVDHSGVAALPERVHGASLGVDLHGRGPDSQHALVRSGVGRLIAFRNPAIAASSDGPDFDANEHEVTRWCRLLRAYEIEADPRELDLAPPDIDVARYVRGATLVHPGAASASRRWPSERWSDVIRAEHAKGRAVVMTGGANEVDLVEQIARNAAVPREFVYAGRTTVRELAALVAAAGRVVCGDTGVAHLATALRRPSVVLFGPTPPATWGPPARPYHRVLWNRTTGDPHGDRLDPGLAAVSTRRVIAELDALPAAPPRTAMARTSRATA